MFFILTSGTPSVNKIDLQALTLAGPTVTRPVSDPLAVLSRQQQTSYDVYDPEKHQSFRS